MQLIKKPLSRIPVRANPGADQPDSGRRVRLDRRVAEIAPCMERNLGRAKHQKLVIRVEMFLDELDHGPDLMPLTGSADPVRGVGEPGQQQNGHNYRVEATRSSSRLLEAGDRHPPRTSAGSEPLVPRRERTTGRRDTGDHGVEAISRKARGSVFRFGTVLDDAGLQEVVKVDDPLRAPLGIHDKESGDRVALHDLQRCGSEGLAGNRLGVGCHAFLRPPL